MGGDSIEIRNRKRLEEIKMERLSQKDLLEWLDKCWSLYKTSQNEYELTEQAYQQIRELILCEDMVQQYRDEMDMEHAELELTYLDIVLDLYEQLEAKSEEHDEMKTGIHEISQIVKMLKKDRR